MARFDDADYVDPREREAALAIKNAAERLQAILYYLSTEDKTFHPRQGLYS